MYSSRSVARVGVRGDKMNKTKRELEMSSRFVLGKISYFYLLRTRGAVCVLKEAIVENFKYLLLRTLTLCFARVRGLLFMPFLCRSTKKGRKKRNPAEPLGASRGFRRGVAASGFLYRKALGKVFAFPFCSKFVQTRVRRRWQKLLLLLVACYFRARIFSSKCERKS
jgi:hypothetical protein